MPMRIAALAMLENRVAAFMRSSSGAVFLAKDRVYDNDRGGRAAAMSSPVPVLESGLGMHAVVLERIGGPLEYTTAPDPTPGPDEVLVRVRASAVCGRDLIDARGGFPAMKLPAILGHEFAGEVAATGPRVDEWRIGDRVVNLHRPYCGECPSCLAGESVDCERAWQSFGHTVDGGYAELVVAHRRALVKIPDGIELVDAAPLQCTAAVALRALRHVARLELGEQVLVTGASGGVGVAAIQIARHMGARVVALTSSAGKAERLRVLGAEVVVSSDGRFHEAVKERSGGGVDVVLELTGSATFASALKSLRRRGRMVIVGNIMTERVSLNPGPLILYGYTISGSHGSSRRDLADCFELLKKGALKNLVDRTLSLSRASDAHALLGSRSVTGRVVLLPEA